MRPRAPGKPERFCGLMGMHRYSRRQLIQGGLALAGFSLLSGCEMPGQQAAKVRRIGFLAVGSGVFDRGPSPGAAPGRLCRGPAESRRVPLLRRAALTDT